MNSESKIAIIAGFDVRFHKDLIYKLSSFPSVVAIYVVNGCDVLFADGFHFPQGNKLILIDSYYPAIFRRGLTFEYYCNNLKLFQQTFDWLEDEKSRITMQLYLDGHINLKEYPMLPVWSINDVEEQYFPKDIIRMSSEEVFVDCGAYTGDTYEAFTKCVDNYTRYYAIEPDERRRNDLEIISDHDNRVVYCNTGTWSSNESVVFSTENLCGEIMDKDSDDECAYIKTDTIDNIVSGKVTFIKMDIEGAELQSLYGAERTIRKNKPKLAICVYHKKEDLITIPQYIKSIHSDYKLYLRVHFPYVSELVLYAV